MDGFSAPGRSTDVAHEKGGCGRFPRIDRLRARRSGEVVLEKIIADVNLDMISRSATGELNIVGAHTYPVLQAFVDTVAALGLVRVRQGHEGAMGDTLSDLTDRSDQGSFKHKKIPFVMFNNEEHADYHRPTDEALRINPEFFYRSAQTAAAFLRVLDGSLDRVELARQRHH